MRQLSSFFGVRSAGTPQGLRLSLIYPHCERLSTCLLNSVCSMGLIHYAGKFGNEAPGTRSMACWISRNGGSSLGSSSGTRSANFLRGGSTFCGTDVVGDSSRTCLAIKAYMMPCSLLSSLNFRNPSNQGIRNPVLHPHPELTLDDEALSSLALLYRAENWIPSFSSSLDTTTEVAKWPRADLVNLTILWASPYLWV
eukprot:TRINITY_DN13018_c2_g2_i1.p1 TRINITY_DN13018_c2_g2~~TRINITY_DN13018_c2_g2_i1.p1  ORF type:complete len:209 (-),score=19.50 TRINITY_DN13018_c2_g2_i1:217-807(-)